MSEFDFRICPKCNGFGVRDTGRNCKNCGGSGSHGLHSTDGVIGSGEIIIERATGRTLTVREFLERSTVGKPADACACKTECAGPDTTDKRCRAEDGTL
jgi:hypothetical protein